MTAPPLLGRGFGLHQGAQLGQLCRRQLATQAPGDLALHHAPGIEHGGGILQAGLRHLGTPVVPQFDDLVLRQALQGLAHHGARDRKGFGQLLLAQPGAGREAVLHDGAVDAVVDAVGRGGGLAGSGPFTGPFSSPFNKPFNRPFSGDGGDSGGGAHGGGRGVSGVRAGLAAGEEPSPRPDAAPPGHRVRRSA